MREAILEECNSVNVTWSPPTREALGDPVTSYLAQIRRSGSQNPWMNCTSLTNQQSTSCLFPHLEKYPDYEVRVLAKNKVGYSLPSGILRVSMKEASMFCYRFLIEQYWSLKGEIRHYDNSVQTVSYALFAY